MIRKSLKYLHIDSLGVFPQEEKTYVFIYNEDHFLWHLYQKETSEQCNGLAFHSTCLQLFYHRIFQARFISFFNKVIILIILNYKYILTKLVLLHQIPFFS